MVQVAYADAAGAAGSPAGSELPGTPLGILTTVLRSVALVALASGCAIPAPRQSPALAVLYRQEAVRDLRWNTQVFYTAEAPKADPGLHNGFVHPDLNDRYAEFNAGHTQFAMFGQVANPVPAVLASSLESLTGLQVPPADVGSCQLGVDGGAAKGIHLQFRDTTQNRDLWFVVRLYQNQFARPSDPWTTLMDREALAVDGTDPATSIGLIDAILRPGATRVTPVRGSAFFSLTPFSGERYFAFDLSGSQFRQALQDLNAARVAPVVFSENPADYQLKHYNTNVESWAPSAECDPRIGLSWRDITISMIGPAPAQAGDGRGTAERKSP